MARPLRINRTGAWHHVMSRANEVIPFSAATSIGAGSLGFLVEGVPGRVARAGLGLILANSDGPAVRDGVRHSRQQIAEEGAEVDGRIR